MQIQGLTKRFRNKHISRGHIISSLSPDSTDLLILPEPFFKMVIGEQGNSNGEVWNSEEEEEEEEANGMNGVEEEEEEMGLHLWEVASNFREMRNQLRSYNPRFLFPLRGPYSVTIDQHQLHILSATNASGVGFQRLTLGNVPDFSLGRKTVMTRDISAKDFTDKAVYIQSQIFTDLQPPYTVALRGTPANDVGRIEILQVVGIEPTQWHCPLEWFGDDVCDCNCGEFDIDCADPSVEAFSQKVDDNFDTVHCNQLNDDPSFNGGGYYDSSSSDSSYYGPSSSDSSYYDSSSDNAKRYCPYNPGQPDHAKCTTTRATGNDTLIGLVLEDRLLFRTPIRLRHTQGDIIETSFPAGTNQV